MARPVSNPPWFVTNGKRMLDRQELMVNKLRFTAPSTKRGIGAVVDAVATVLSGARLPLTVEVPRLGRLLLVLATQANTMRGIVRSRAVVSALMISQTAWPVPPMMDTCARPPNCELPALTALKGPAPLGSVLTSVAVPVRGVPGALID